MRIDGRLFLAAEPTGDTRLGLGRLVLDGLVELVHRRVELLGSVVADLVDFVDGVPRNLGHSVLELGRLSASVHDLIDGWPHGSV